MLEAFLKFISNKNLATPDQKILVAVSGGIDSVVLLHLFARSTFEISIAHCNFHLRGMESDNEEKFVRDLAKKYDIPCFVKSFNTSEYAANHNLSIQIAARQLRYDWFSQLLKEKKYDLVATAHHLNDSIETVIYNLTKGTGLAGLRGIPEKNNNIIRPLLFTNRDQIEHFAQNENLNWKEDSSNISTKYNRNFLRHKVVPLLKEINPSLEDTFKINIDRIQQTEMFLEYAADKAIKDLIISKNKDIWINRKLLDQLPGKNVVLARILEQYGFKYVQVMDIMNPHQTGKIFNSGIYQLNIDRGHYIVSVVNDTQQSYQIDDPEKEIHTPDFLFKMELKSKTGTFKPDPSEHIVQLDYDKLQFPLQLRRWQEGDKFQPLGMKGKKKLSDYMIDEKIPVNLKSNIQVITDKSNNIVWVVSHRIDERFKVREDTKNIITIKSVPRNDQLV